MFCILKCLFISGGGDYVEDGREIFDDDLIDHDDDGDRKKPKNKKEKAAKKAEKETQRAGFLNVRDMLSAMPVKRKRSELTTLATDAPELTGEDLLGDLLKDIHAEKKLKATPVAPNFLDGVIPENEDLVQARPRLTPQRPRVKPANVPKKKFVPFGAAKTEASYDPCPTNYCKEELMDNHFDDSMDTIEIPDPEPLPKSVPVKITNGTSNGTKVTEVKAKVNDVKIVPKFKPAEPVAKNVKSIENFDSFGQISGNGAIESSFTDNTPKFFEEGDAKVRN